MANTSKEGDVNAMKQDKAVQSLQKYSYEPKRADQNAAPTVLSAIAEAGYIQHTSQQTPAQLHAMKLLLRTRHSNVFQFNGNQTAYISPPVLRGTPVKRITESSSYWQPDWLSLDKYLAAEANEIKLKEQTGRRVASQGITSKTDPLKREHKLHMDNCSKHIKIREIFGPDSAYHPNQLVAKRHLPVAGLCEQEIMYKMACKISDLQVLHKNGELAMDPFEFYRFQVAQQIEKHITHPGQGASSFIKALIRTLGDDDTKGGKFQDPVFRIIVRRAAHFTGRSNSYGSKNTKKSGRIHKNFATPYVRRSLPAATVQCSEHEKERRQRKLAKRATQPTLYGGINAYRSKP